MKQKHLLVLAATIVAVVGTALFASCEKEEITTTPTITPLEKQATVWIPGFANTDEIDPDNIYGAVSCRGMQRSYTQIGNPRTIYCCDPGFLPCKYVCIGHISSLPNYTIGDVIAISRNAQNKPERLYYIFDNEVLKEEGVTLGNILTLPYDVPIQDSYRLNLATNNTTLFFPAGEYTLTHKDRAIYFSIAVDSLIRDTRPIDFE